MTSHGTAMATGPGQGDVTHRTRAGRRYSPDPGRTTLLTGPGQDDVTHRTRAGRHYSPDPGRTTLLTGPSQDNASQRTRAGRRYSPDPGRVTLLTGPGQDDVADQTEDGSGRRHDGDEALQATRVGGRRPPRHLHRHSGGWVAGQGGPPADRPPGEAWASGRVDTAGGSRRTLRRWNRQLKCRPAQGLQARHQ